MLRHVTGASVSVLLLGALASLGHWTGQADGRVTAWGAGVLLGAGLVACFADATTGLLNARLARLAERAAAQREEMERLMEEVDELQEGRE